MLGEGCGGGKEVGVNKIKKGEGDRGVDGVPQGGNRMKEVIYGINNILLIFKR